MGDVPADQKVNDTHTIPPQHIGSVAPQTTQINPISVGSTKEAGPTIIRTEAAPEKHTENEQSSEQQESMEKKHEVKHKKDVPDIHPDAAAAGVQVAPSASPFPTIYDIKVPLLKDEEIEADLHKDFWTSARWLAEICKYILWQAHIRLKKIGGRVVRERMERPF